MKNENVIIKEKMKSVKGKYRFLQYEAGTDKLVNVSEWTQNLVLNTVDTGIGIITRLMIGDNTYQLEIDSAEIGTGTNPATDTDEDLQTPVLTGILRSNQEATSDTVTLRFFIADADLPDGIYKEFLLRCGTQAFARSLISPFYTKPSGKDTIVEYVINLSN